MNKPAEAILHHAKKFIQSTGILSYGDTVIVGVSGGPDSVALLHILLSLRHELGLTVQTAHFNHNWRKSAQTDERFVERMAKKWDVPFFVARSPKKPGKPQGAREERARFERLEFFRRLAKENKAGAIFLAHTQDDLVETVLMHILRGTGLQGMRGMLPHREIYGIHLVRPLLGMTKQDILLYLKKNKISFRHDPTNRRRDFFRNQLRLDLIPLLERQYSPGIKVLLANLADTVATDYEYIEAQAKDVFKKIAECQEGRRTVVIKRKAFLKQPAAIQRMLIRLGVERLQYNMNRLTLTHLRQLEKLSEGSMGSVVHFPGGIRISVDTNYLKISSMVQIHKTKNLI